MNPDDEAGAAGVASAPGSADTVATEELAADQTASAAGQTAATAATADQTTTTADPTASAAEPPQENYLADLQRLKAEFDNYRRRVKEQQHDTTEMAVANLVEQLLPVVDACEAALSLPKINSGSAEFPQTQEADFLLHEHEGLIKLAELLFSVLDEQGLRAIRPEGEAFDPNLHEAIMYVPSESAGQSPTVTEVVRTGYLWRDKLLRAALVKVAD